MLHIFHQNWLFLFIMVLGNNVVILILAEFECATPTIITLIHILFSTLGVFTTYTITFVANQLIFALKTSTLGNKESNFFVIL